MKQMPWYIQVLVVVTFPALVVIGLAWLAVWFIPASLVTASCIALRYEYPDWTEYPFAAFKRSKR